MKSLLTCLIAFLVSCCHVCAQMPAMQFSEFFTIKKGKGFLIPIKTDSTGYYALTCDTFDVTKAVAFTDYVVYEKTNNKIPLIDKKYLLGESQDISIDNIFSGLKPREIPKQKIYLVKFDTTMKFLWKKEVSYKNNYYLVNIIPTDDKMYFFFKTWNKSKKTSALYYTFLKIKSSLNSKYIQIDTIPLKNKNWEEGSFQVITNDDYSRVVTFNLMPEGKYKAGVYNVSVFDSAMKMIWKKTVDFEFPGKYYTIYKVLVSGDKVFFLTKVKEKYNELYEHAIYIVTQYDAGDRSIYMPLPHGDNITAMDMQFDPDGDILLTGFYSNGSYENPLGMFTAGIDINSLSLLNFKNTEFSSLSNSAFGSHSTEGLHFRHVFIHDDGSRTLFAEYYHLQVKGKDLELNKTGNYSYSSSKKAYALFNDVAIIHTDEEGNVQWTDFISKAPNSLRGIENSFTVTQYSDSLFVFYNQSYGSGVPSMGVKAMMNTYSVDGGAEEHTLFDPDDAGVALFPKLHNYQHDDELLFFLFAEKQYRLLRLRL